VGALNLRVPFVLTVAMLEALGWPSAYQLFWIVACMVLARSAGMAFNRWVDAELDARNLRTRMRAIRISNSFQMKGRKVVSLREERR
jgi:4-hydroxybenzoate polyprenyltransferase